MPDVVHVTEGRGAMDGMVVELSVTLEDGKK